MNFNVSKIKFIVKSLNINNKMSYIFAFYNVWAVLINYSLGYNIRPAYVLAMALMLMVCARLSRLLVMLIISLLSISAALYLPGSITYGSPSVNTIAAVRYTSLPECIEFIRLLPISVFFLMFIVICLGVYCIKISKEIGRLNKKSTIYFAFIAIIIVFFRPVSSCLKGIDLSYHSFDFTPVRFIADIYDANQSIINEENDSAKLLKTPDDWNPSFNKLRYDNYILVIGESVRKDYLNAYGYKIHNTPFLSKSAGKFFDNYYSASFSTVLSLTSTLNPNVNGKIEYNNSIIRLAKKAGFKTFWLSNQGRFGTYDGPIANIGKQADFSYFIKNGDSDDEHYYPDSALMPVLEKAFSDHYRKKLIVLHLMGSHPGACDRTRGKYDFFYKSKDISCYIQSIRDTDNLLKQITEMANKKGTTWSMLYFADHGLRQYDKGSSDSFMEHDDQFTQSFTPPLIIISSDDTRRLNITNKRSGMDFVPIFSQWLGINDKRIPNNCNLLLDEKCKSQVYVIDNNQKMKRIETLADDPAI